MILGDEDRAKFVRYLEITARDADMAAENLVKLPLGLPGQELIRGERVLAAACRLLVHRLSDYETMTVSAKSEKP